jgi:hypothetical protein
VALRVEYEASAHGRLFNDSQSNPGAIRHVPGQRGDGTPDLHPDGCIPGNEVLDTIVASEYKEQLGNEPISSPQRPVLLLPGVGQRISRLEAVMAQQTGGPPVKIVRQLNGLSRLGVEPVDAPFPQRELITEHVLGEKEKAISQIAVEVTPEIRLVPGGQVIPFLDRSGGIQVQRSRRRRSRSSA